MRRSCIRFGLVVVYLLGLGGWCRAEERSSPPWDLPKLQAAEVKPEWGAVLGKARELFYPGEPFQGKPTRVFAYYARPTNGDGPFPTVLLVHGGGGKAFREWAEHWAARGYCALAMDLAGHGPEGKLADGGPDQSDESKFRPFDETTIRDMWSYHAIANIIRGHNLLRSLPEVDRDRIAVTGISWGGYLTCIVAGLDHRLKAAVPVYGCGFLHENSYWKTPRFDAMPPAQRDRWVNAFDPSKYLPNVKCPILFLNGTNDFAYPMDSYLKSYSLVPGTKAIAVRVRLPHGHIWTFGEVDAFIDSQLRQGEALPKLGAMQRNRNQVSATVSSSGTIKEAHLNFAFATGAWQQRDWKTVPAIVREGRVVAELPPDRPLAYYLTVTDARGLTVSTTHEILGVVREEIEWLDVWVPGNSNSTLPKVLLIGDSITRGYTKEVEDRLQGKAVVCRLTTSKSLGDPGFLAEVKLVLSQTRFDVIHFNNGLHGWGYTEAQYAEALPELLALFRDASPRSRLIWATTTPMRTADQLNQVSDKTERVKQRNALAATVMTKEKIATNDLFTLVEGKVDLYSRDGVHFNARGNTVLAEQVAKVITPLLGGETKK